MLFRSDIKLQSRERNHSGIPSQNARYVKRQELPGNRSHCRQSICGKQNAKDGQSFVHLYRQHLFIGHHSRYFIRCEKSTGQTTGQYLRQIRLWIWVIKQNEVLELNTNKNLKMNKNIIIRKATGSFADYSFKYLVFSLY